MADDWSNDGESIALSYGDDDFNRQSWRIETLTKLEYYESEYQKLKESTSLLELALWKAMILCSRDDNQELPNVECKTDAGRCAEVVIKLVLTFL
jgi:hypothetical protein